MTNNQRIPQPLQHLLDMRELCNASSLVIYKNNELDVMSTDFSCVPSWVSMARELLRDFDPRRLSLTDDLVTMHFAEGSLVYRAVAEDPLDASVLMLCLVEKVPVS